MQREEGYAQAADGARLYTRRWTPDGHAKATVCLLHGVCEHSGRYERIADFLTGGGYAVSSFDFRGHGRSSGRRGDARFEPTLRDVHDLVERERARIAGGGIFLYGQSLGGLVALAYALDRRPALDGIVAAAPALRTKLREQRLKVLVAMSLGRMVPSLSLRPGLDPAKLMRDASVLEERSRDPLVHDRVSAGLARDALLAADRVLRDARDLSIPLLLVHGDADEINSLRGSEEMFQKVRGDRTLKVYEGVRHHPHNDPDRDRIFRDVISWLDAHVA